MAVPSWFDKSVYFDNKLARMGADWDALELKAAFEAAGYAYTEEGLYQHFMDFGKAEGVSPTSWFDEGQYLYNKAAQYYGKSDVTANEVRSMDLAMAGSGMSAWDHFDQYWAEYYDTKGVFLNPSSSFDVTAYMNDKLAQMQQDDPAYTMDMLIQAFQDAGLNPVEHYSQFGRSEGLTPTASSIGATIAVGDEAAWGTNSNDYFSAGAGVLDDDTYIDGLGGDDTLHATIKADQDTVAPHISNVETVLFRAQRAGSAPVGNLTDAEIDAEFISGMKVLGSDNSRDSLRVEDVRIDSTDLTIRFSNSDPGDVDFSVYFDPQHLTKEGSRTSGTLQIELMDVRNAEEHTQPLRDNPFDQFKFQYTDNNGATQIVTLELGAIKGAATYGDLLAAFQQALQGVGLDSVISAKLGGKFTAEAMVGGHTYTSSLGQYVVLDCSDGTIAVKNPDGTSIDGTGWGVSTGTVPVTGGIVWDADNEGSSTCPLVQTNVELDNVGRVQWADASPCLPDDSVFGSEAGDLVIGSMAGRGGIERFDVVVDKGSWLSSLSSTNDTLRMVTVRNGAVEGANDNGNLFIGTPLDVEAVGHAGANPATDMELAHWMNAPRLLSTDGLTNVKVFDASEMAGKVNIGAQLTAAALDKYMVDVDGLHTVYNSYAPRGNFQYLLGTSDDTLNLKVNAGIAADRDFDLDIRAGTGNDLVNFRFDGFTQHQLQNQIALDNVSIDLGAGDDELWFWGDGAVKVNDGEGNDRVYVGQNADDQNAVWVFNADADGAARAIHVDAVNGAQPLNNDVMGTIGAFAYTGGTPGTDITLTVAFKGISSEVVLVQGADVPAGGGGSVGADAINAAIIAAIRHDPTLSALLAAKDGAGHSLLVESLVDGLFSADDLTVTFDGATTANLDNAYDTTGANSGFATEYHVASHGLVIAQEGGPSAPEVQVFGLADGVSIATTDTFTLHFNGQDLTVGDGTSHAIASGDGDGLAAALEDAIQALGGDLAAATVAHADGAFTINTTGNVAISNDTALYKDNGQVTGSGDGTISMNTVGLSLGDDVIALNVDSAAGAFDTLVLTGAHGNDTVLGFQSAIDKIDVSALVSAGGTHSGVGTAVGGAENGALTVAEALASINGLSFAADENGVALVLNNTSGDAHTYTVFQVNNDGTAAVAADEVTVLGTLTVGDGSTIATGDLLTA